MEGVVMRVGAPLRLRRDFAMKINYDPHEYQPQGATTFRSWSDSNLQEKMRELFGCSERERLVELVIDKNGLMARFEPK